MKHLPITMSLCGLLLCASSFAGCGGEVSEPTATSQPPAFQPRGGDDGLQRADHPDKEQFCNLSWCENWREVLPIEKRTWNAPWRSDVDDPRVRETLETYFAAQHPIDGKEYQACAISEMFKEIDVYSAALRRAYFGLAPELQVHRGDLILLMGSLFEEATIRELLTDAILEPYPEFDPDYLELMGRWDVFNEESQLRSMAVTRLADTAPDEEDVTAWLDSLYQVILLEQYRIEYRQVAQIAVWELRNLGVRESQFRERVSGRLSTSEIDGFVQSTWD